MKARKDLVDKESKDDRLKLYSAGRQGKFGDNNDPKPGMFDIVGKLKWEAWNKRKGEDQEACKLEFVTRSKAILAKDTKKQ
ncbi:acyl--binding protein [Stylonychia lemnae]|uniref:Acyl--binding protein n=1 Tax=Stylonychia lemnae TaxID=5949 RepID=A0A078AML3_STYLE|nr:acyl--binding protein [Stylonychia lemnae]|eukprot:CDW83384.1 acyl--binding protein [Stylonychia lemnae]